MKYLTEEEAKWQPLEVYSKAKECLNKKVYSVLWRDKYSKRTSVGPCQDIARKTSPLGYEDFFNKYLNYANEHIDERVSKRGCTLEELENVAYKWMEESGNPHKFDFKTFYYGVITHVIIETVMGKFKEVEVIEAFKRKDSTYNVLPSTPDEDAEMGIDFKVVKNGELMWLVQVKPISFILGHKIDLVKDRQHVFAKHALGHEKYPNVPYAYIFYNSQDCGKWIYNCDRNGYFFKYEKLVSPNGYPLVKPEEILKCQKETIEI